MSDSLQQIAFIVRESRLPSVQHLSAAQVVCLPACLPAYDTAGVLSISIQSATEYVETQYRVAGFLRHRSHKSSAARQLADEHAAVPSLYLTVCRLFWA